MRKHTKNEHFELVLICREVTEGNICQYADSCWYMNDTSDQIKEPLSPHRKPQPNYTADKLLAGSQKNQPRGPHGIYTKFGAGTFHS